MTHPVRYSLDNGIASIMLDDGKANAMSFEMMEEINKALDQAEADNAIVAISGRPGIFSAGFHLKQLGESPESTVKMLTMGARLSMRMLMFPQPTIIACTGHAYPMGAFLLLSADYRIGVEGPFEIGMNEVLIGISAPSVFVELAKTKLVRSYFSRTEMLGEMFDPAEAVKAGFLDQIAAPDQMMDSVMAKAEAFKKIDVKSHRMSKKRSRTPLINSMESAIEAELTLENVARATAG